MFARRLLLRGKTTTTTTAAALNLPAAPFFIGAQQKEEATFTRKIAGTHRFFWGRRVTTATIRCGDDEAVATPMAPSTAGERKRVDAWNRGNQRRGYGSEGEKGGSFLLGGGRGRRTRNEAMMQGRRMFGADAGSSSDVTTTTSSSSSSTSERERLGAILRAEIKHEAESYEPSETAKGAPPDGWTLNERDGDCDVYLSKEFGEDEEILVYFSASDDPMETEYGRDENETDDIIDERVGDEDIEEEFSVTIMKTGSGKQLEFFCVTDGELIEIQHVQYEGFEWNEGGGTEGSGDKEGEGVLFDEDFDENNYSGPHFEDLDKGVQDAFLSYLEERGINAQLADYIVEKRIDKEQREYTSWLEKVADFVK